MNNTDTLSITINGKRSTIRIRKSVIKVLRNPEYICLRVHKDFSSIAMLPCKSTDFLSFKTPDNFITSARADFRIYSKQFTQSVFDNNNLNLDLSYLFSGRYLEAQNAVIFDVIKATPLEL